MRFRILVFITFIAPVLVANAATTLDPSTAVNTLNLLISQYESRIKQLEAENAVLRNEMMKAGIKIPLSDYSGVVVSQVVVVPSNPIVIPVTVTWSQIDSGSGLVNQSNTSNSENSLIGVYGKDVAEFVKKINSDWNSIKDYYKFNSWSRIAWYEFVQSGANDHVFVDIVIGSGTTWVYDMKVLYQYEKKEYKRKLLWIFEYNATLGKYSTRPGWINPFAWVPRTFVKDPGFIWVTSIPATVSASGAAVPVSNPSQGTNSWPTQNQGVSSTQQAEIADILKAYSEKKYLSTISLSNTYLEKNPATIEILNVRYRTYFIIGKFNESLAELAKMEKLGGLDRQTACNAQVIATYSKNQTLIDKYTAVCKK